MSELLSKARIVPMAAVAVGLMVVAGANIAGAQQRRLDSQKLTQQSGQTAVTAVSELPSSGQPAAEAQVGETKNDSTTTTTAVETINGHTTVTTSGSPAPTVTTSPTANGNNVKIDVSTDGSNGSNSWSSTQSTSIGSTRLRTSGSRNFSHSSVFSTGSSYSESSD